MIPEVPAGLKRVVRSRRAGNWRDWFCPEDVAHYRPLFAPFMERYAYADDWVHAALDALPDGASTDDIRALYRICLGWCDENASAPRAASANHRARVAMAEAHRRAPLPTASFVLCIENNAIRDQAMMLCESIRRFGGDYRDAQIVAFSPRAGLAVDREARRALSDLNAEYVDEPIYTTCHDYPPANRVFAGAWAEARSNSDFIVVRDSGAELFSQSLAAGMRPYRGSVIDIFASTGPVGQAGSEYWGSSQAVLALAIWAATDRVVHFPGSYNLPLHLVASKGEIDPQWNVEVPVHVHYHYMFTLKRYETAMEILARIGVPADRMAWLAARIPFVESSLARQVA